MRKSRFTEEQTLKRDCQDCPGSLCESSPLVGTSQCVNGF